MNFSRLPMHARKIFLPLIAAVTIGLTLSSCKKCDDEELAQNPQDTTAHPTVDSTNFLKINQLQLVGSHNSYRVRTYQPIYDFVQSISGILPADPDGWDYTHLPLDEQLDDYNMRSFELDIYYDPNGGLFYERKGLTFVSEPTASNIPELQQPGMKVMHIPDFDYMTNYYTFVSALTAIKTWSDAHPRHVPIVLLIESKEETIANSLPLANLTESIPFDATAADAIDAEIKSVFGATLDNVFTPDDLHGSFASLNEAALNGGWPTLAEARGKILFVMEGPATDPYLAGHPQQEDRAMFIYGEPGEAGTAFVILNNPKDDIADIQSLVEEGYFVRTRADSDTEEARTGDYTTMNAAFESGAQVISTDYYRPDPRGVAGETGWTDYHVTLPGNPAAARINPISAADKLSLGDIKE